MRKDPENIPHSVFGYFLNKAMKYMNPVDICFYIFQYTKYILFLLHLFCKFFLQPNGNLSTWNPTKNSWSPVIIFADLYRSIKAQNTNSLFIGQIKTCKEKQKLYTLFQLNVRFYNVSLFDIWNLCATRVMSFLVTYLFHLCW